MTKTILVPLDGSDLAAQILPHAAALAKKTGAELLLLSVIVPVETWLEAGGVFLSDKRLAEEADAAMAYLTSAQRSLEQDGLKTGAKVVYGKATDCIRQVAEEQNADIIGMTTHGRSGLPRLMLGSVASEIVRTASQPVLLVHANGDSSRDFNIKRILVPIDGSSLSESILPVVEDLARALDAELILLRVISPPTVLYPGQVVPSALPALDDIEVAAKEYVDEVAGKLREKGFTVTREVSVGYAPESIQLAAAQHKVDLIAMSSHGRTGFGRWVMGSVADSVVSRSPQPCLVIRPPAVARDRPLYEPSGVVEIVGGVTAAGVVVPPPTLVEHEIERPDTPPVPEVKPHRPERRMLT